MQMKFQWYEQGKLGGQQWYMSKKLDGIFVRYDHKNKQFLTSQGNVIHVPKDIHDKMPPHDLDMELYAGIGQRAKKLNPIIQSEELNPKLWKHVVLVAFDVPDELTPFSERLRTMLKTQKEYEYDMVDYLLFGNDDTLVADAIQRLQKSGEEGLVLKKATGMYSPSKRSWDSLKHKPRQVTSARILSLKPGKNKWLVAQAEEINVMYSPSFKLRVPPKFAKDIKQNQLVTIQFLERKSNDTPNNPSILEI